MYLGPYSVLGLVLALTVYSLPLRAPAKYDIY